MGILIALRRHTLETLAWLVAVASIILALMNQELFRLVVGAFGPPPDTGVIRILLLAEALIVAAWWQARRSGAARRRFVALGGVVLCCMVVVVVRSRGVTRHNVSFEGNGIRFGATLYEPTVAGPYATVVFVAGSAPFKRGLYALWAEHLARQGVMSIVADKRGVGGTGGEFERNNNTSLANLSLLANDAVATLDYASRLASVDTARLGLFGVSQAGWSAPMAAILSPRAHFIIMVTGPTVSVHEEGTWSDLMGDDHAAARLTRAQAEKVMDTVTIGGVDARPRLAALTIPGLWLFGSADASIPTRRSVEVLDSLNRTLGKRFTFDSVPGFGHLVMGRAGNLIPRIAPSAWKTMDAWLAREVLVRK